MPVGPNTVNPTPSSRADLSAAWLEADAAVRALQSAASRLDRSDLAHLARLSRDAAVNLRARIERSELTAAVQEGTL